MEKLKVLDLFYEGSKIYYDTKGYACVWREGKNKKVHVLEWEKHNGAKPDGHEIHHIDEIKGNWIITNLELLTNSDHQRIHAGWVRKDGDWVAKPCSDCLKVLPLTDFYPRKGLTPSAKCRTCHCIYTATWSERNREKRRAIGRAYYHRSKRNA